MESHEKKEEAINYIKEEFKESKENTFTKGKVNWFIRYTLPKYCLITVLLFVFVSVVVNIVLGLLVLGICILVGIGYYYII